MTSDPNQLRMPLGYICPICNAKLYDKYRPFCGECGRLMPSEQKLQALGLTIYPHRYGPPVRSIEDIAAIINEIGPTQYWLEEYHPTFRTTKIRIQGADKHESDYDLVCTATTRLELPIDKGWVGVLTVGPRADELIELADNTNRVLVSAGCVSLHLVAFAD